METPLTNPAFWESDATLLPGGRDLPPFPAECAGLVFFATSGSTGEPKWIGHTRASLLASARAVNRHLHVDADSCWGLALPIHHVGGFGVLARVHAAGCRLARFEGKWNAASVAAGLANEGVTHLSLVPAQVHDLVAAGIRAPSSLRAVVVGGGVLEESTGRAARALGWPVLASYGMTETASQIATQRTERLDFPYQSAPIDLIDPWEAETGDGGRLQVRGPSLFAGILHPGENGWKYEKRSGNKFVTSDLGAVLGRELSVTGRADTLVKILGELVDPLAVEACILRLGNLAPGAIVIAAPPDARAEHRLVLVHGPEFPPATAQKLVETYNSSCPGFCRISGVVELPGIPRSDLGKPLRAWLTQKAAGK